MNFYGSRSLYRGTHYHCYKDCKADRLKKEEVRFRRRRRHGQKEFSIHVGKQMRTFKEDEFCFYELEEVELLTGEEEYKNFVCMTIVIYKVGDDYSNCMYKGSNRIKLFDEVHPGTRSKLKDLEKKLYKYFGKDMNQWFMYNVGDNNNEQPVRVVLRKTNFSVLDEKLNVLHFHRLCNLEFQECIVNPQQRLLDMKISEKSLCPTSSKQQPVQNIRLRSSMTGEDIGYSFRTSLCNHLHEIRYNDLYNIHMSENVDSRVVDWVKSLQTPIPGCGTENTDTFSMSYRSWCNSEKMSINSDQMSDLDFELESQHSDSTWKTEETTNEPDTIPTPCVKKSGLQMRLPNPHIFFQRRREPQEHSENMSEHSKGMSGSDVQGESCVLENPPCCSMRPPRGCLIRADSVDNVFSQKHDSCNISDNDSKLSSNVTCNDSEYQQVYYKNLGWVKCRRKKVSVSQRIQRQRHIDLHIRNTDFKIVNKHEEWWDNGYKMRDEDNVFMRTVPTWKTCTRTPTEGEDRYWNGDLCLTVQLMMEKKEPKLLDDLDLSWSQLLAVTIHLSLDQQQCCLKKDWRDFAELLGLKCRDIEIIQHFCYTQREWTARVVLCHWKWLASHGRRNVPAVNFDNLRSLLIELGRDDILKIVDYPDTNCCEKNNECTPL